MIFYFSVDENNRLQGVSSTPSDNQGEIAYEFDNNHEIVKDTMTSFYYKYVDGEVIKDTEFQKQRLAEIADQRNKPSDAEMNAIAIMELTQLLLGGE